MSRWLTIWETADLPTGAHVASSAVDMTPGLLSGAGSGRPFMREPLLDCFSQTHGSSIRCVAFNYVCRF